VWDLDTGEVLHTLFEHTDIVRCVTTIQRGIDNAYVISGGDDRLIVMWSLIDGTKVRRLEGHSAPLLSLAVARGDGVSILASCGVDRSIRLWNILTGDFMFQLVGHQAAVTGLVISSGNLPLIVSVGRDMMMKVWDVDSGRLLRSLPGHSASITCVAMSRSTQMPIVVTGDMDGNIIVWDFEKMKILYFLQENLLAGNDRSDHYSGDDPKAGRWGQVYSVAVSSGKHPLIVTASWRMPVKIWDSQSGGLLRAIEGTERFTKVLKICRDSLGPLIAMGQSEGGVLVSSPERDFDAACRSFKSIDDLSLEASLELVGKFIVWVRLLAVPSLCAAKVDSLMAQSPGVVLALVYSMVRFGYINTGFFLANVDLLRFVLMRSLDVVDLLFDDMLTGGTPIQFLLERRVCLGLAQQWMKSPLHQVRVMGFLADPSQSSETLETILSALVTDNPDGWDFLFQHENFGEIFINLFIHSPRSHDKLAYLVHKYALYVESQPFHVPLRLANHREVAVLRWSEVVYDSLGVHCYRIRVNERFPLEFFMSHRFLEILVKSEHLKELLSAPLIEYIIKYRWESWGYNSTLSLGFIYVIYLLCSTNACFCICSDDFTNCATSRLHIASVTIVVLINTLYMGIAALQYRMSTGWDFLTIWNVTDIAMIILCHLAMLLGSVTGPTNDMRHLCAILALLQFSRMMYFGRGSQGLASLLHQMRIIIWEVRYFVFILAVFLCSYGAAFHNLAIYDSLFHAFILCFNMMLGDVSYDYVAGNVFAELLYLTFLLCVAIILLNSLIAFMGGSLDNAREREHTAAVESQASLLCELEIRLLPFSKVASLFSISKDEMDDIISPSALRSKGRSGGGLETDIARNYSFVGGSNEFVILIPEPLGRDHAILMATIGISGITHDFMTRRSRRRMMMESDLTSQTPRPPPSSCAPADSPSHGTPYGVGVASTPATAVMTGGAASKPLDQDASLSWRSPDAANQHHRKLSSPSPRSPATRSPLLSRRDPEDDEEHDDIEVDEEDSYKDVDKDMKARLAELEGKVAGMDAKLNVMLDLLVSASKLRVNTSGLDGTA
jgi:WD40 repeat protein